MAPADEAVTLLTVEVVWSPVAAQVLHARATLPEGSTLADALNQCGLFETESTWHDLQLATSIWGRLAGPTTVLRAHDRVEVTRALLIDPKEARRQRHRVQAQRPSAKKSAAKKKPR